ncbi:MAG: DUF6763 family protein [Pseudomonadota bacterium]|nr:DUF6763 family protein [Pseudomonadota bacterium]
MGELDPIVGQWYLDLEQDDRFKVVAVDERGDEIDIEYEDGETRTVGFDEWYDLDLDLMVEEESGSDEPVEEPPNDFYRPARARRYREEDDDEDDDEDDADLEDDWDE